MENQILFASAMIFCLAIVPVYSQYSSKTVNSPPRVEKMTRLHFFFHDIISGENPTAILIARPNITAETSKFGRLFAIDDPLTIGPDLTPSTIIGNALGLYVSLSRNPAEFTAVLYTDFAFTSGRFKGSSFSLFSRYPSIEYKDNKGEADREMAVVGGRGVFRLATGFALISSTSVNATTGNSVQEFNVTLYHY